MRAFDLLAGGDILPGTHGVNHRLGRAFKCFPDMCHESSPSKELFAAKDTNFSDTVMSGTFDLQVECTVPRILSYTNYSYFNRHPITVARSYLLNRFDL